MPSFTLMSGAPSSSLISGSMSMTLGELLREVDQAVDRRDDDGDVEREGHQRRDVGHAKGDQQGASGDCDQVVQLPHEADACLVAGHLLVHALTRLLEKVVGTAELLLLEVLLCEGLHLPDALDGVLGVDVDVGDRPPHGPVALLHPAAEDDAVDEHDGKRDQRDQRQRHRDSEHEDVGKDYGQYADQEVLGTMVGHLSDLEEVVRDAAHDRARLRPVEVAE